MPGHAVAVYALKVPCDPGIDPSTVFSRIALGIHRGSLYRMTQATHDNSKRRAIVSADDIGHFPRRFADRRHRHSCGRRRSVSAADFP
jgi:hypothetical protein